MIVRFKIQDYINKKQFTETYDGPELIITFGRSKKADIRINDQKASNLHCEFIYKDGKFLVLDKDSTNGTFIGDERIDIQEIGLNEKVSVGDHKIIILSFEEGHSGATPAEEGGEGDTLDEIPALGSEQVSEDEAEDVEGYEEEAEAEVDEAEEDEEEHEAEDEEEDEEEEAEAKSKKSKGKKTKNNDQSSPRKYNSESHISLENPVTYIVAILKGMLKNPLNYFDNHAYKEVDIKEAFIVIALCSVASFVSGILQAPMLGVFSIGFYLVSTGGFCLVCEKTQSYTEIQATKFQVLHFIATISCLGLVVDVISKVPGIGFIGSILGLVYLVLGIKGFFKAFSPKVVPMIVVIVVYAVVVGIVSAPIFSILTPKVSEAEQTKQVKDAQDNVLNLIKKAQKLNQ